MITRDVYYFIHMCTVEILSFLEEGAPRPLGVNVVHDPLTLACLSYIYTSGDDQLNQVSIRIKKDLGMIGFNSWPTWPTSSCRLWNYTKISTRSLQIKA